MIFSYLIICKNICNIFLCENDLQNNEFGFWGLVIGGRSKKGRRRKVLGKYTTTMLVFVIPELFILSKFSLKLSKLFKITFKFISESDIIKCQF